MSRYLSLFSGIGGLDRGFDLAGWSCAGQVELNPNSRAVLAAHWPECPRHDDVKTALPWATGDTSDSLFLVDGRGQERAASLGQIDATIGGFPCQDLSRGGKRAGLQGSRSGLFWDALAVADAVRSRWLVLENVPGLLTSNEGADFHAVIDALVESGYTHVEWRVLDAQHFGVPQRRRRLFIVGHRGDLAADRFVLPELTGGVWNPREGFASGSDRADSATHAPSRAEPAVFVKRRRAASAQDDESWAVGEVSNTLNLFDLGDVRATQIILEDGLPRRMTPVEHERLQGFPDGWTVAAGDDGARFTALGNAVAVPVAASVARRILEVGQ